jgi:hypothetical protein
MKNPAKKHFFFIKTHQKAEQPRHMARLFRLLNRRPY